MAGAASTASSPAGIATNLLDDLLPMTTPTATSEPWQCSTETLSQYLQVPMPSGNLLTALISYNDELIEDCAMTTNIYGVPACVYPDASLWCDFTKAMPTPLVPVFSSYATEASSWWAAHSSKALSLAQECPLGWFDALLARPGGEAWLNQTLIFADCLSQADAGDITTDAAPGKTSSQGGAVSKSTPTSEAGAAATKTTGKPDSSVGKLHHPAIWTTLGISLAAMVVTSAW